MRSCGVGAVVAFALAGAAVPPAHAQLRPVSVAVGARESATAATRHFELAAMPLDAALRRLAKQADLQILFAPSLVAGRVAPPVTGALSTRAALDRLLDGTGLVAEERGLGVYVVRTLPRPTDESAVLASVTDGSSASAPTYPRHDLEPILVTARRRPERLQDVPISVVVHNRRTMDAQGTRTMDDVARLTPGVSFVRGANNNNSESSDIAIRGIASNAGAATTGIYVDDTPIQGRHLSFPSFNAYPVMFDVERVEVLRGPQGTLFGAGSQGGTVRFISPEPSLTQASLYARTEFAFTRGGDPVYEAGVAGGTPLVPGRLAVRASASLRHEGGYVDRVDWHSNRVAQSRANWNRAATARLALNWAPTNTLTLMPSVVWQRREANDTAAWWVPRAGEPDPTNGQFAVPFRTGNAVASPNTDRFVLPALKAVWAFEGLRLTSSSSYFERRQSATTDYTQFDRAIFLGTPYASPGERGAGFWADEQRNWTQELRLESTAPDARVRWTAGVFWQRAKETTRHRVHDPDVLRALGAPPTLGDGFIYVEDPRVGIDRQLAVFGQADVRVTPRLELTLGLRYAHAEFEGSAFYPETLVVGPEVASRGRQQERPLTPKFGLQYAFGTDTLGYATATKGYRIGGVNARVGQFCYGPGGALDQIGLEREPEAYDSDSLWCYEIGAKSTFARGRGVVNASAYFVRWNQIQQNVGLACGFQFTSNLGEAQSRGIDLYAAFRPTDGLSLGGTFGYTEARFTRTVQLQPDVQSIVRDGDRLAVAPWTLAVHGEVSFRAFARPAYFRIDHQYGAPQTARVPAQNPLNGNYSLWFEGIPSQDYTSVRAGVVLGRADVSLFAQNVLGRRPRLTSTQDVATATGGSPLFYSISYRPRTIGVTATYRW